MSLAPRVVDAHPLHTTMTELAEDRARGTVRATIRVFADDFGTAVARSAGRKAIPSGAAWDAVAVGYAARAFGMMDGTGRPLALASCGIRRTADLVWVCLEARPAQPLATLQVRNGVLCELFDDQVNLVQGALAGGPRRSVLFVKGDGWKKILNK
jgi:hypothetical protein